MRSFISGTGRGGMCSNPTGGNDRLDRIDFMSYASGSDDPYKLLAIAVIVDATSSYLYFGLGKNGTTLDEFWFAAEFFFRTRSDRPETCRTRSGRRRDEE
jgi:hypothetical protein